jgi:formylglycine-generating enzyme required for sulfatase activity
MTRIAPFMLFIAAIVSTATANNLQITNIQLTGQNEASNFTLIRFDISWENSWRDKLNYDAAWLFIKYTTDRGQTWRHATLNTTAANHTAPGGSTILPTTDGKGVFLYRSVNGSGNNNWTSVQLRWEYGTDGLADSTIASVKVFGVEMVFVPQGAFYLGDGSTNTTNIHGDFQEGATGQPFHLTSEGAITLGGTSIGDLNRIAGSGQTIADDWASSTVTLPAAFPKGYKAFYGMKYELTQEQFKDFLNTLTRTQQDNNVSATLTGDHTSARWPMQSTSFGSPPFRNGIRLPYAIPVAGPVTFYNDLDNDSVYNESSDGQNIAVNYLNWSSSFGLTYADWAALRPMTELEYEKACRGDQYPVADEFAWGTSNYEALTGINNSGMPTETWNNTIRPNCNTGWGNPSRVGIFATGSSTEEESGGSYLGIMELTGNTLDLVIDVGSSQGRSFTGTHGDGELSTSGGYNAISWPNSNGLGYRGGGYNSAFGSFEVSDRISANNASGSYASYPYGARFVRTAP